MIGLIGVFWVVIGVVGSQYEGKLTSVQKNDSAAYLPKAAESTKEATESLRYQSVQAIPGFVVYQRPGGLTAADRAAISKEARAFRSIPGVLAAEVGSPEFAADRVTSSVAVPYVGTQSAVSLQSKSFVQAVKSVLRTARSGAPPGLIVHSAGPGPLFVASIDAFSGIDGTLLLAAGIVVFIVLLVVYRSPFLWLLPVFSVILALGSSALVIFLLVRHGVVTLNGQSQAILCILVPGVGTDYALLLTSRYRDELRSHQSRLQAMTMAWKRASTAIVSSGCTVSLALLCLTLARLNSARSLGPVCAIGIACTVAVMLSFLPLALTVLPRGVFWPRVPRPDHTSSVVEQNPWTRFAAAIGRHDRRAWVGATLVLLVCAAAMSTLKTGGLSSTQSYTDRPDAVVGQSIYNAHFVRGSGEPAEITARVQAIPQVMAAVSEVPGVAKVPGAVCVAPDLAKIARAAAGRSGSAGPSRCAPPELTVAPRNGRLLVDATLGYNYDSQQAYQTIERIRSVVHGIPGAYALVGGASATNYDTNQASRHDRDLIIPVILLVILVVLALLLRAIVAPLLLILSVVLSFTASLGISALVFKHVFHFANADPLFPLLVFVFLVALGVDYNIFLMTRVREETLLHGTADGVLRGLAVTGGVITSAGIVLAATFAVLVVLPLVFLAEVAFTIALGVLLDTVIVRSILVPALCHDMGKQIWWPSRLAASPGRPVRRPTAILVAAATIAVLFYTWIVFPSHLSIQPNERSAIPHGAIPSAKDNANGSLLQPNGASGGSGGPGSVTRRARHGNSSSSADPATSRTNGAPASSTVPGTNGVTAPATAPSTGPSATALPSTSGPSAGTAPPPNGASSPVTVAPVPTVPPVTMPPVTVPPVTMPPITVPSVTPPTT